jgi:hypothetical protein
VQIIAGENPPETQLKLYVTKLKPLFYLTNYLSNTI